MSSLDKALFVLGDIAGVNGQNSKGMCQGGKPGTGI